MRFKLRDGVLVVAAGGRTCSPIQVTCRDNRESESTTMRSFTDVFIKHPVLAVVINLVGIVLVGWRALTTLLQQYPKIESSSIVITTVYYGASAETVQGF